MAESLYRGRIEAPVVWGAHTGTGEIAFQLPVCPVVQEVRTQESFASLYFIEGMVPLLTRGFIEGFNGRVDGQRVPSRRLTTAANLIFGTPELTEGRSWLSAGMNERLTDWRRARLDMKKIEIEGSGTPTTVLGVTAPSLQESIDRGSLGMVYGGGPISVKVLNHVLAGIAK